MRTSTPHSEAPYKPERRSLPDLSEYLPKLTQGTQNTSTLLSQIFGWIAEEPTLEKMGLRSAVALYCIHADLIEEVTLEELSTQAKNFIRNTGIKIS